MHTYEGNDNYGKPKSEYTDKLKAMDDKQLKDACEQMIWLSAYSSNNLRSDYHWQCDACYDECSSRDKVCTYEQAHKYVSNFGL